MEYDVSRTNQWNMRVHESNIIGLVSNCSLATLRIPEFHHDSTIYTYFRTHPHVNAKSFLENQKNFVFCETAAGFWSLTFHFSFHFVPRNLIANRVLCVVQMTSGSVPLITNYTLFVYNVLYISKKKYGVMSSSMQQHCQFRTSFWKI